jgi:hypothetical protein
VADASQGKSKTGLIIAIVVVVVLLLCCCCVAALALLFLSEPGQDILWELGIAMAPMLGVLA